MRLSLKLNKELRHSPAFRVFLVNELILSSGSFLIFSMMLLLEREKHFISTERQKCNRTLCISTCHQRLQQ